MPSSNLMKTFGAGADVGSQLSTDRALRRKSTSSVVSTTVDGLTGDVKTLQGAVADAKGQVMTVTMTASPESFPHTLGRVPAGGIILLSDDGGVVANVTAVTDADIEITSNNPTVTLTVWVV